MRLGEHVRIARKRRGLTMEEMAAQMYVTRKTLFRLEKGGPGVRFTVLASLLSFILIITDLGEESLSSLLFSRKYKRYCKVLDRCSVVWAMG